jgi:hypothetical protein
MNKRARVSNSKYDPRAPRAHLLIQENLMDNLPTAHAAAEQLAALLIVAGISPRDIAEALVSTGMAFMAADNPEAAVALTAAYFEAADGK